MSHDIFSPARRRFTKAAVAAVAAVGMAAVALPGQPLADDFPTRPITMVVPFNPGGASDIIGRLVAEEMSRILGQNVLVDNRAGAGGAVGTASVANSAPDGYTMIYSTSGTTVVLPLTNPELPYDPDEQLTAVGQLIGLELILVARKDFEHTTIPEIVEAAKADPGAISIGNTGVRGLAHLVANYLAETLEVEFLDVAYQGDGPQLTALVNGELDLGIVSVQAGSSFLQNGEIVPVAMLGDNRASSLPDTPTVAELGYDGFSAGTFGGLHVPAGTPENRIQKLHAAMAEALTKPEIAERIDAFSAVAVGSTPQEFTDRILSERELWRGILARLPEPQ
ncbi:MAG: tripartite tricarboxylate transporter substrate binding protein [Salinarimonadaceae bacterium]|nr:MAG: tripartite tricarboxylate transporter substrate binding protein [Salinarimonadaceae bacterium]